MYIKQRLLNYSNIQNELVNLTNDQILKLTENENNSELKWGQVGIKYFIK